jgi:hypothetical protein
MTCNRPTDILTITPRQCAEGALNDLGYERFTHGFWTHKLQSWLYSLISE